MTELEKIARAKMYTDKLSQGINPINDAPISFGDDNTNIRLAKCFAYVSEVLERVIKNGGTECRGGVRKKAFDVSSLVLERIELSDAPIPASELAGRISAASVSENMKRLSARSIIAWLVMEGFLVRLPGRSNTNYTCPTADGLALGITAEVRNGQKGNYTITLYDKNAQQFIVDNIDAVVEAGEEARIQKREERRRRREKAPDNGV